MRGATPGILFVVGGLLDQATVEVKKLDWEFLDRSTLFMWGSGALASALFTLGLFLALRNLLSGYHRYFALLYVFCTVFAITAVFAMQIGEYVVFSKLYALPLSPTHVLPKLIDNVQSAKTEAKRRGWAQAGYRTFGVVLAYRKDDGSLAEYLPTVADGEFWHQLKAEDDQNASLRESIIGGQLKQLPYVLAINAGAIVLTFLSAATVFAFKGKSSCPLPA